MQSRETIRHPRLTLLAGVSALAVVVAAPDLFAADLGVPLKAPEPPAGTFSAFIEGGATWSGGGEIQTNPPTVFLVPTTGSLSQRPKLGWEVATGFDYRFALSPWHVSAQFRYGAASTSASRGPIVTAVPYPPGTATLSTSANSTDKETHWLADFAVGRDMAIGSGQVKFGMRIAELTSKATTLSSINIAGIPIGGGATASASYLTASEQDATFRGAGPRVGFEGAVPLGRGWQVDYLADGALLFGTRRLDNPATTLSNISAPGNIAISGALAMAGTAHEVGAVVPNLDAQLGLSYWFNQNLKVTASYRIDAYFGALSTIDANGREGRIDRYFHGPRLALTGTFGVNPGPAPGWMAAAGPAFFKAPPAIKGEFKAFAQGGAFWTGGDPAYTFYPTFGALPGFFALKPKVGWDAGTGFDYRFAGTPWHVSTQIFYGDARRSDSAAGLVSAFVSAGGGGTQTTAIPESATTSHVEKHWFADFAAGRDIGIGRDSVQIKAGVRVAELTANTSTSVFTPATLTFAPPIVIGGVPVTAVNYTIASSVQQQSKFRGAGPRVGLDGEVPLWQRWSLDYAGDAAVLFGTQWVTTATGTTTGISTVPPAPVPGLPATLVGTFNERAATVFNADLQVGVSYWLTQNVKLTAAYRLDAFFGGLPTFDAEGGYTKADRYYHGPKLAVTGRF